MQNHSDDLQVCQGAGGIGDERDENKKMYLAFLYEFVYQRVYFWGRLCCCPDDKEIFCAEEGIV